MSWRTVLQDLTPPLVGRACRQVRSRLLPGRLRHYCPACRRRVEAFLPLSPHYDEQKQRHGYIHSPYLTETMNRKQYECPRCGASDRDRLYALFLERQAEQGRLASLLDIAPSGPLSRHIATLELETYRTADLSMSGVDDVVDITGMTCYEDGAFGAIICSHVLEHDDDDGKAMRELHRILAPGGWAVLMVPINLGLGAVYEDPTITDPGQRWKHFGQEDHVRVYSKGGFVERLTQAGFTVEQHGVEAFGEDMFNRCGIAERSVLYIGRKTSNCE